MSSKRDHVTLNKGKVSIFYAEQIAHLPAESQPAELKRIQETIKRGKPLTDDKTVVFPGTEQRLEWMSFKDDMAATAQLELKSGLKFNLFQRKFAREWRKLVREFIKEHSYLQMWEIAEQMVGRISVEFPDKEHDQLMKEIAEHTGE
jgi:hypothetical protein